MSGAKLNPNVVKVIDAGRDLGLTIETVHFPDGTKTAADAAAAIGVHVGQIVKSLIFAVDGQVVLAYVSGSNQLDESKLAVAAGGIMCSRVDADTVRAATGFRSAACRRSGTQRRCRCSSTRIYSTTVSSGRQPAPGPTCFRSLPPTSSW